MAETDRHERPASSLRTQAWGDWLLAASALVAWSFPDLREWSGNPGVWVLSDWMAATFVAIVAFGRGGVLERISGLIVLVGSGVVATIIAIQAEPLVGILFLLFTANAFSIVRAGDHRTVEEIARSYCAVMAAGIPTVIVAQRGGSGATAGAMMALIYFGCSGWFRLHPPMAWVDGHRAPRGD